MLLLCVCNGDKMSLWHSLLHAVHTCRTSAPNVAVWACFNSYYRFPPKEKKKSTWEVDFGLLLWNPTNWNWELVREDESATKYWVIFRPKRTTTFTYARSSCCHVYTKGTPTNRHTPRTHIRHQTHTRGWLEMPDMELGVSMYIAPCGGQTSGKRPTNETTQALFRQQT